MSEYSEYFTMLFFGANIIYCLAYLVTKMVWLRMLTIVAALCTFPYFYFQLEPLWSALFWQSCFLLINLINLAVLYYNSLPLNMTEDEKRLQTLVFRNISPREVRKLLEIGESFSLDANKKILDQGQENSDLFLLSKGSCKVLRGDKEIGYLHPGHFIGEMSFVSNQPASADVVAEQPIEFVKWNRRDLDKFFVRNASLKQYFYTLLGLDMAEKLRS